MAKIITIEGISANGKKLTVAGIKKLLVNQGKVINSLSLSVSKNFSNDFGKRTSVNIRKFWQQNYLGHFAWAENSLSAGYARLKDLYLSRGDSFKLGSFGVRKIAYGSGTFGLRTGTIHRGLGNKRITPSFTRKKTFKFGGGTGFSYNIKIGLNDAPFDNKSDMQYPGGRRKEGYKLTANNYMKAFSSYITKNDSQTSVLVALRTAQLSFIRKNAKKALGTSIRKSLAEKGLNAS